MTGLIVDDWTIIYSLWLVLSPTNDMIVLGTENTDHRGIGTTTEERAEPAYNKQVLISKT
ncbi:MAG: hypothetical protein Q8S11_12335 [Daejeonella sp.]|uniref:hypothetical protein n=1 Tax=Daejeonella sp. TaxID=2805397 RepID=UPI00273483D6|nr:hypothetical protein [Daejeonella sp.]MDP3469117.1 hypothetical protein [Daejeonella sp.]